MSIVVEHEKRRYEILEKALDVFMDEGFENATFQKIADKCGITRTTLYIYFKNKRDIFNFSIKQLLQILENDINNEVKGENISYSEKLIRVMTVIMETLEKNRRLLSVVLDYLVYASKNSDEYDPDVRFRRRTVRLRHIQATLIINGIKAGEFSPSINVKEANELFYSILEAVVFRLVILCRPSADEMKDAMRLAVNNLCINPAARNRTVKKSTIPH